VEGKSVNCSHSNKEYETSDNELNDMQSNIEKAIPLANEHFYHLLPRLDEASRRWEGKVDLFKVELRGRKEPTILHAA
jgi:hypothetical protein